MGTRLTKEEAVRKQINKKIEQVLEKEGLEDSKSIKMLLLGAAESGKSTVVKQMQILHSKGFTDEDRRLIKGHIFALVANSMYCLLMAIKNLDIQFSNLESEVAANHVEALVEGHENTMVDILPMIDSELAKAIRTLWSDSGVQQAFSRRNEFQLNDCAKRFFDDIERLSVSDYLPDDNDMLHSRVVTIGIVEVNFVVKGVNFRVFDVAGQKSERRKWIHCFDHVNSVIFVGAVSEFDQSRMVDTLNLYESVVKSVWFSRASIILFLNKKDLFEEKLNAGRSIKYAFPDYDGPDTYEDSMARIKQEFEKRNSKKSQGYVHETCATDTNQVQLILDGVISALINSRMSNMN